MLSTLYVVNYKLYYISIFLDNPEPEDVAVDVVKVVVVVLFDLEAVDEANVREKWVHKYIF